VAKSAEAFRTISEAADELDVPQHVLRHWEEVFGQVRPMRRAGGRRYYRPSDIDLLGGIRVLLYDERYTTKGVQKIFKDEGVKYISELGRRFAADEPIELRPRHEALASRPTNGAGDDGVLELGVDARIVKGAPGDIRRSLSKLILRLEKVQDAIDDAALALEAIEAVEPADTAQRE